MRNCARLVERISMTDSEKLAALIASLKSLPRYDLRTLNDGYSTEEFMEECDDGRHVEFDDIEKLIEKFSK